MAGRGKRFCEPCDEFSKKTAIEKARTVNREAAETRRRAAGVKHRRNKMAVDGTRWCNRCAQYLRIDQFQSNKGKSGNLGAYCKPCGKSLSHELRMKRIYGISHEQYYALLDKQGGVCAICKMKPRTKLLAVDHDHKTNLVRGLLCTTCNSGILAGAKDRREILVSAINYLDNPPARGVADDPIPD